MHLSRISIRNFRNFSEFDVQISGNIVIVGENRVGKSNLLYALRLIFDAELPDSARQLGLSDFWDGLEKPGTSDAITISVEIVDFETDLGVLATLTDYRLDDDADTVRLTYTFRPRADLEEEPGNAGDYEFVCFGGENEAKRFGHDLRRRITMDLLPALRDAEGDLAAWRRSPLRPLIEDAFNGIDQDEIDEIGKDIETASARLKEFPSVGALEETIRQLYVQLSGKKQDVEPRLGIAPTDSKRLYRNLRLLIDNGARGINDASLGSANLVFLTLKTLDLNRLISENRRNYTILAIEEPEAHLHPHLQRTVYSHLFRQTVAGEEDSPLSVILTTHSPHIASVAPIESLLLLRQTALGDTVGRSTATLDLGEADKKDLSRYLDVTRAEMLFARGVILVEGDAERFLIPAFAEKLALPLDQLGITVCSVAGTNFQPYAKFLGTLGIPFAILTDWDPRPSGTPLGRRRGINLAATIRRIQEGINPSATVAALSAIKDKANLEAKLDETGIFINTWTLEIDLFNSGYAKAIIAILREANFGPNRSALIAAWEEDESTLDPPKLLALIDDIGKGRFAQRLATQLEDKEVPSYIERAIAYVAARV